MTSIPESVTFRAKRYIFVCAGCNGLCDSDRKDQMTCSATCRVKAHRNGETKRLKEFARINEVQPELMMRARALSLLCPELAEKVSLGNLKIADTCDAVRSEYTKLLSAIRAH